MTNISIQQKNQNSQKDTDTKEDYMNRATLLGNIFTELDLKSSEKGQYLNFTVVTSKRWVDKQTSEKKERPSFHRITCYGKTAELISKFFQKGDKIFVEGEIQYNSYEKNGQKMYSTSIIVDKFEFCSKSNKTSQQDHPDRENNQQNDRRSGDNSANRSNTNQNSNRQQNQSSNRSQNQNYQRSNNNNRQGSQNINTNINQRNYNQNSNRSQNQNYEEPHPNYDHDEVPSNPNDDDIPF